MRSKISAKIKIDIITRAQFLCPLYREIPPTFLMLIPLDLKTYLTTSKNLGQGKQNLVHKPSDLVVNKN